MTIKVKVIGSGSSEKISLNNGSNYIFCNSSVIRTKDSLSSAFGLMISDGMLLTDKEFCSHPPTVGLSSNESLQIRRLKQQSLYGLHVNNLIVNTNKTEVQIKDKIEDLNITYDRLILLDNKTGARLLVDYFGLEILSIISSLGVINACKFFISIIAPINYKPPPSVRASTGMLAYLWAKKKFDSTHKVVLDGIGNGNIAYYPGQKKQYNPVAFNKAHTIDDYIYKKYNRLIKKT
jgi:hypothetical protein